MEQTFLRTDVLTKRAGKLLIHSGEITQIGSK
jgi:hypothetical protein